MPREGKQTALIRRDGFVPVAEIAKATGMSHSNIIRMLVDERMPGKREGYRWFVDAKKLAASGMFAAGSTIQKNVEKIAATVGRNAPAVA